MQNPYYDFSLFFIAFWVVVQYVERHRLRVEARPWGAAIIVLVSGAAFAQWRHPYFAMSAMLVMSLYLIRWASVPAWKHADSLYSAVFFTMPLPYLNEILAVLQWIALKMSLALCALAGRPLESDGSLVFLKDGPVRLAAACSGFQSIVVLVALAGMASFFLRLSLTRKFLLLFSAAAVAIGFNVFRVTSMFWAGNRWGVAAAVDYWHGLSAWIFYMLALGATAIVGRRLSRGQK